MKHNAKKRTLRLEQLENRELLSATTWDNAAQADAAVAAEMAATLNETAPIDLTSAFSSAAETEAPLEIEVDTTAQNAAAQLKDAVEQIAEGGVITLTNGGTIELSEVLTITKTLSIVADDNATILNQEGCGFAVSNSAKLEVSGVCFENPSSDLFNVVSGASAIVRDSVFSGEFGEWVIELDGGGAYKSIGNIYNQTDGLVLFHVGDGSQIDMANDVVRTKTTLLNGKNVSGVEITVTNSTIDLQDQERSIVNGIKGTVTLNNSLLIGVVNVKSGTVNANNVLIYGSFTGKAAQNLNNVAELDSTTGLFVDYAQGDYRLVEGSKAIDKGVDAYAQAAGLVKDIAGNNRIVGNNVDGNNVDLGAYEYGAGPYVESLDAPTVSATPVDHWTLEFEIGKVAGALGYVYQYSTDPNFVENVIDGEASEAGTFEVGGLNTFTTYYFRAQAINGGVASDWSDADATTWEAPSMTVTTETDVVDPTDGLISLREAACVYSATDYYPEYYSAGDVVDFVDGVANVKLTSGEIEIVRTLSVVGGDDVTVDAQGLSRVFNVVGGTQDALVAFSGLTIAGGAASHGAGVYVSGAATFENVTLTSNEATVDGGGVYVATGGYASFTDVDVTNNKSKFGAGVYVYGAAKLNNVQITENVASDRAGGLDVSTGGVVEAVDVVISANQAKDAAGVWIQGSATVLDS
ncbi:MAG: fibronectin type III domain-containing protein, partial [Thermoguttaceae bacterium]|nr:fibronectin type III domain-containing protein [Thermoguttaceae bacterium]